MSNGAPKKYTLDALRGFASIVVVLHHVVQYGKFLDPDYLPDSFNYFNSEDQGHLRVLILFVISGTVISLNNRQFSYSTVRSYLKKRFIRLYPIYLVGLVMALSISSHYSMFTIAGNFLFMDVLFTDVIMENGPIWTLHYEILFYLLFIPIALVRIDPVKVFLVSIAVGLVNFFFIRHFYEIQILTSYSFAYAFWAMGMIIVKYFSNSPKVPDQHSNLVSFLFLILAVPSLNILKRWMYDFAYQHIQAPLEYPYNGNINDWFKAAFILSDFSYLPYCFLVVVLFSGYHFKGRRLLIWIVQILPFLYLLYLFNIHEKFDGYKIVFPSVFYSVSLILLVFKSRWIEKLSKALIDLLIWFGRISYGIYIVHIPILILLNKVTFFSGSVYSFSGRLLFYFSLIIAVSYFLERIFQPLVASYLTHSASKTVVPQKI